MPHLFRLGLSPFSLSMALFDIPNSLPCLPCQASVHQCEVICFYFIFWTMLFLTIMRLHALDTRSEGQSSHPAAVGESRIWGQRFSFEPNRYKFVPLHSGNFCDYGRWSIHPLRKRTELPAVDNSCLRQGMWRNDWRTTSVPWAPEGSVCAGFRERQCCNGVENTTRSMSGPQGMPPVRACRAGR